jgi:hypothetical protein
MYVAVQCNDDGQRSQKERSSIRLNIFAEFWKTDREYLAALKTVWTNYLIDEICAHCCEGRHELLKEVSDAESSRT